MKHRRKDPSQRYPRAQPPEVSALLLCDPIDGEPDHFSAILEAELFLDVSAMGFDGLDAEMKLVGDFASAEATAEKLKHLEFAIGEFVDRRTHSAVERMNRFE